MQFQLYCEATKFVATQLARREPSQLLWGILQDGLYQTLTSRLADMKQRH